MKKYVPTLLVYAIAFILIYALGWSPGMKDGGWGFGMLLVVIIPFVVATFLVINIIKGFKNSEYFFIAFIHLAVLVLLMRYWFGIF